MELVRRSLSEKYVWILYEQNLDIYIPTYQVVSLKIQGTFLIKHKDVTLL